MAINLNDFQNLFDTPVSGQSAQINPSLLNSSSLSWGTPVPTPAITPTVKTTSVPIQSKPLSVPPQSGGNFMDYYAGWDQNSAKADFAAQYGSDINKLMAAKGGGGGSSYDSQIDSLFSSTMNAYGNTENMYRQQAQGALEDLTSQGDLTKSAYQQALDKSKEVFSGQTQDLAKTQQSLMAEAVRQANATRQQAQSRYGGGSSLGGALSEIVSQEFMRTAGSLRDKYIGGIKAIQSAERDADTSYNQAIADLNNKIISGRREIQNNLTSAIQEIELRKASLEDEKKAMRVQAVQAANQQAMQLEADKKNKLFDLGLWVLQRREEQGVAQKQLDDLASQTMANLKFQQTSMTSELPNFQASTSFSPNYNSLLAKKTNVDDPYNQLLV